LRQEEGFLIDSINEQNKNCSASMINLVIEKAESKSTCAESTESKEASFIQQEHDKLSKTTMLDFPRCKEVHLLPYEFRAKEVDDHQGHEDIAEQCLVDREHQTEESQDPEQQEYKALDNHQKGEQGIVLVMQLSRSSNVFKEVSLANNLLVSRFGQNYIVHASISKIFIRNMKRPIMRRKLFISSNKIVTNRIDQRVVPLR
jgi:ribosomal protein S25